MLGAAVPAAGCFFLLPYIERNMGEAAYGIYTLVIAMTGYFTVLDLGLSGAVTKYVAEYRSQEDVPRMNELIGASLLIILAAGTIGGTAILSLARILVTSLLKIPIELRRTAYLAFRVGAVGFLFSMLLNLFTSVINGLNRYSLSGTVSAVTGLVLPIGIAALLHFELGLLPIVVFNISTTALSVGFYVAAIRHVLPMLRLRPMFSATETWKVLRYGAFSLLSRVTELVTRQLDLLIIGAILGVNWVTYYVIPFKMVSYFEWMIFRVGTVTFPAFSGLQGQKQWEKTISLYLVSSKIIVIMSTAVFIPAMVMGPHFLRLWMSVDFARNAGFVIVLIAAGTYLNSWTNIPSFIVNGLGHPRVSGLAALYEGSFFLILMVPLSLLLGIKGVALAYFISNACSTPLFVWYVTRHIVQIPLRRLLNAAYLKPLLVGLPLLGPLLIIPYGRIDSLLLLVLIGMGAILLYVTIGMFFGLFSIDERVVLFRYLRTITGRVKG